MCEAVLRFGRVGLWVRAVTGGYVVSSGVWSDAVVPSVGSSLTTFLPAPVRDVAWLLPGADMVGHAVWTGVAAVGVAWAFRRRGWVRLAGAVPLALACVSHAAWNAGLAFGSFADSPIARGASWAFEAARAHLVLIVAALVVVDRIVLARAARLRPDLVLPGEAGNLLNPAPLWRTATVAPPWSVLTAWYVVLGRRAGWYGLAAGLPSACADRAVEAVQRLASASDKARWHQAAQALGPMNWRALASWRVLLWFAAMLPGLAYLVAGGFPATRGLQVAMAGPVGTAFLLAGLAGGVVLACVQAPGLVRRLRRLPDGAWHEAWLRPFAALAIGGTSVLVSVALVVRLLASGSATDPVITNAHVLDAVSTAIIALGIAMMILAILANPPSLAALAVLGGEGALTLTASEALAQALSAGLTVTIAGILLAVAGTPVGEPGKGSTSSSASGGSQMLGAGKAHAASSTKGIGRTAKSGTYYRVDVENPNPGKRPGQIHIHVGSPNGPKYTFGPATRRLTGDLAQSIQRELLSDPQVVKALDKALEFFGLPPL